MLQGRGAGSRGTHVAELENRGDSPDPKPARDGDASGTARDRPPRTSIAGSARDHVHPSPPCPGGLHRWDGNAGCSPGKPPHGESSGRMEPAAWGKWNDPLRWAPIHLRLQTTWRLHGAETLAGVLSKPGPVEIPKHPVASVPIPSTDQMHPLPALGAMQRASNTTWPPRDRSHLPSPAKPLSRTPSKTEALLDLNPTHGLGTEIARTGSNLQHDRSLVHVNHFQND